VDGEYQSKGIGGTLFRACCEHVKSELNAETAVLWVIEQRSDLQKWYEKLGFEFSGEMKDFVFPSKLIDASTKFRVYLKKL
jgi:ribosomal protein S18 acetylase RimI-like enzyme